MIILPNLGLKVWNLSTDPYNSTQLAENFQKLDDHDHAGGRGKQIPTGGIADGAITSAKMDPNMAIIPSDGTVTTAKLVDGSVTSAKLADDAVTNAKILADAVTEAEILDGSIAATKMKVENWTSHTPTITNMTLGDGTVSSAYLKYGKTIHFAGRLTFGSTSSFSGPGAITFSLPHAARAIGYSFVGTAMAVDVSATTNWNLCAYVASGASTIGVSTSGVTGLSGPAPFTWATGDLILWNIIYHSNA